MRTGVRGTSWNEEVLGGRSGYYIECVENRYALKLSMRLYLIHICRISVSMN